MRHDEIEPEEIRKFRARLDEKRIIKLLIWTAYKSGLWERGCEYR